MGRVLSTLRSKDTGPLVLLAAWPFIYFWPVTLAQSVFYTPDIRQIYLPFAVELARALGDGRLPFWTPTISAGFPLFAEGHVAALYLPCLFLYRFLPTPQALSIAMLAHLAWAGCGMYLCARSFRLGVVASLLAGVVFSFNGFAVEKVYYIPILVSSAWLPWMILFQNRFREARRERKSNPGVWFVLAALAIAMQLYTGFPQVALLSAIAFAAFGVYGEWANRPPASDRLTLGGLARGLIWVILPAAMGALIASAQWLPSYELMTQSVRGSPMGYEFVTSYSLPPQFLTELVWPYSQSEPDEHTNGFVGYFGLAPLALAGLAPFVKRDRWMVFCALFAVVALSFAFGETNPISRLVTQLPLFNSFRSPSRYLLLFEFAAALLAAGGLDELLRRLENGPRVRNLTAILALLAAGLTAAAVWFAYSASLDEWLGAWRILPLGLGTALGITLVLGHTHRIPRSGFAAVMIGLTFFDLASFAPPMVLQQGELRAPEYLLATPRSLQVLPDSFTGDRLMTDLRVIPTIQAFRASLYPNSAMVYDRESVQINSPLVIARYSAYLSKPSPAMLNLLNVRHVLVPLEPRLAERTVAASDSVGVDLAEGLVVQPPSSVQTVELVSFTENADELELGTEVGALVLSLDDGSKERFPLRAGIETADWDYARKHAENPPANSYLIVARSFPGFWRSFGRTLTGRSYSATFRARGPIEGIALETTDPKAYLTVEGVTFRDDNGGSVSLASLIRKNDYRMAFMSDTVAIWENLNALPRASMVYNARVMDDSSALAMMQGDGFDPERLVVLNEGTLASEPTNDRTGRVDINSYAPERVLLTVATERAGYLLLTDTWFPGWSVTVDGESAPLLRADLIFRAVRIEPGEHHVVFEYRPVAFYVGSGLSLVGLAAAAGVAMGLSRRSRSRLDAGG